MILVIIIILRVQTTYSIQTTYVQFVEWFYDICLMYHSNQVEGGFMCDMSLVRGLSSRLAY